MGSKFYDIPFLSKSAESDFSCRDGEIESAENVKITGDTGLTLVPELYMTASGVPPVPEIEFAITRSVVAGWHILPDSFPSKVLGATEPGMEYWNKIASQLLGRFQEDAASSSLFTAPFYVMAAWRMSSGILLSPSSLSLQIPNSEIPMVTTDGDIRSEELEMKIAAAACSLNFRMNAPEILRDWVGRIKSIDIFVSSPLHDYSCNSPSLPYRNVTSDNYCRCLDRDTGLVSDVRVCTRTLTTAWKSAADASPGGLPTPDSASLSYRLFASIPLRDVDLYEDMTDLKAHNLVATAPSESVRHDELGPPALPAKPLPAIITGMGKEVVVTTRPLKLSGGNLKCMARIYLRGFFNPEDISVGVYGSRDMQRWWLIAERKGGAVVGLPRSPFRYYKVRVSGHLSAGDTLEGLTVCVA